jgi:SAM-dependent methyltransferase
MNFIRNALRYKTQLKNGILCQEIRRDKTIEVTSFYKTAPFPNFEDFQSKRDLAEVVEKNIFLKDLKNSIGFGKTFLEVGSGTSQLSLALAINTNNLIVALDPTKESLKLGVNFANKNNISGVMFFNADIFDNPCEEGFFDYVWCSGVLHHTADTKKGFEIISKWTKPNGLIIIGLYNTIGRLRTNFRQMIYKLSGKSKFGEKLIRLMDPHLRKNISKEKSFAWFRDQYEHPVERKHSLDEVINWFDENNIKFLGSIPSSTFGGSFKKINEMDGNRGTWFERICAQIMMLFSNLGGEGGLFIVIGQRQ